MSWSDFVAQCQDVGGQFASTVSKQMNDFVVDTSSINLLSFLLILALCKMFARTSMYFLIAMNIGLIGLNSFNPDEAAKILNQIGPFFGTVFHIIDNFVNMVESFFGIVPDYPSRIYDLAIYFHSLIANSSVTACLFIYLFILIGVCFIFDAILNYAILINIILIVLQIIIGPTFAQFIMNSNDNVKQFFNNVSSTAKTLANKVASNISPKIASGTEVANQILASQEKQEHNEPKPAG